ncbi:MAG: hypothetical protein A3G33_06490 [Omnitrophica bacterium RIFCSPLOWO2_12_FULL_44_17]|uniref:Chromosomal replication initiator protein DnaA n=1 Tax=Candidatus Danuiimicrobium aquiferis TaxID=1801832 RepID=A0A1G1L1E8_9BACT|nr:MAG: hypothetical protein A3B72_05360 [Omnitrophica bacterium RIFCSPHIGHO2_02_FULL_45_28]OGW90011.1 MAG: hypothetical protein A3E74_03435 [Omnitrophica bacterium RIFCSPHIGHO2_12_FULL_44_12]OGW98977.1 MAG: hypothetical protein A3G33_06490 [Omnitrophica bacterium RIFCSPLOWO2_12_FULL_44_17]OGX01599.1 MAG: hypothetical protein A3J12_05940 [Omnitrophica bacterium RIFCSPLOWO2_02_FULL_44_11]
MDTGTLWNKVLGNIKQELSEQSFKTWIEPLRLQKGDDKSFSLLVPDKFYGDWLKSHYHEIIRAAILEASGLCVDIHYIAEERAQKNVSGLPFFSSLASPQITTELNDRYSFDHFVVGPGNQFAHAAALSVSETPAKKYNPLFIYGNVGLGKTHLMQAIAHRLIAKNKNTKVSFLSGEKFTNQLISAIQNRSTHAFRNKYRNSDILLVDDIHFIAGKEATQEEFFNTFNTLYDAHKQIVVTSDRSPKEIPGLEDRLISRFGWGLVVDIQPPDFETRVAILKKKMEKETVVVPDDVVFFIAKKIKSNIRELEGALIRVVAYASLLGGVVDLKTVEEQILRDSVKEELRNVTIDRIQLAVCQYFNIKVSDLRIKRRSKSIAFPRQIAMFLVREMTDHSLPEIGAFFGGRGHATVIHACNKISTERCSDDKLEMAINAVKLLINNS